MRITTLVENTTSDSRLGAEHGLSLLVESGRNIVLFDTGASDLFARNAERLGIDLSRVTVAVLSHGHYDHGGGLETFFRLNSRAPLYVRREAFRAYYSKHDDGLFHFIGVNETLLHENRLLFTSAFTPMGGGLSLFSRIEQMDPIPQGNRNLFRKDGNVFVEDTFRHEQYLAVEEKGKAVMISGCSHRGIINIVRSFYRQWGRYPDAVVGGFHLRGSAWDPEELTRLADSLLKTGSRYYTCHCTGMENYDFLKSLMGDRIQYLHGGDVLDI